MRREGTNRRYVVLAAALVAAVGSTGAAGGQGTGTITGTVTTRAAAPRPLRVTIDQRVCGDTIADEAIVADGRGRLANAVVSLAGVRSPGHPAAAGILNEKCRFAPRVQIVRPDAMMTAASTDAILHTTNAHTASGRALFNVALPVPGIRIHKPVNGPGVVRLSCNTHPWMRGWVVVTDEMAAVTGGDGTFTLGAVPAGTYELRIWHETLTGAAQTVTVGAGRTTTVAFELR